MWTAKHLAQASCTEFTLIENNYRGSKYVFNAQMKDDKNIEKLIKSKLFAPI